MFRGYKSLPADVEAFESTATLNPRVIRQLAITALISLVVFYGSTALAILPVTYYASPNGTSSNTGLSPNSPWPLAYAIAHAATSNTVILLSGKYSGGSTLTPQASYVTIKSQVKWGSVISDIPGSSFDTAATDGSINGIVLDGLCISNSLNEAIILRSGSNHVVRNCWVVDTGKTPGGSYQSQTGIETIGPTLNCVLENNLCERNGRTANFDHGFYIGGTNHIVRGNVVRNNYAYGITLYAHLPWSVHGCRVYDNLVYNNGYSNTDGMTDGIDCEPNTGGEVNYVYCNTVVATNGYGIMGGGVSGCILYMSNNIVLASHAGGVRWLTGTAYGDYNLSTSALAISGPHDVVSTAPNFVNPINGLYWLRSDSPARGKALANVAGPVDFFGNAQTSVTDIGGFQYNSALTSDTRVLDPSPANPDYWANLSGTNSGSASINVTPSGQDCGTTPVGSTSDVTFVVQNNGSTSLSGNASVPAPFSIVSGGSYTLGSGQIQTVAVRYSPTIVGTNMQTVTFTGGDGATATVSGTAIAPPPPGSLTFQAGSAVLSSPMVLAGGYVYQPVDTGVTNGGQAVFTFSLANDGSYIIETVVNAPDISANSFFVNIDAQPDDPTMIWDIAPTTGFEQRTISWRGNGTDGNDQFVPQIFSLSAGLHFLLVVGREANVQLQQLSIVEMPTPPSNLRITASH